MTNSFSQNATILAFLLAGLVGCEKEGPSGAQGEMGATGSPGGAGVAGTNGDPGQPGAKGDPGDPGDPGNTGEAGERGLEGAPGAAGEQGPPGVVTRPECPDGMYPLSASRCVQQLPAREDDDGELFGESGADAARYCIGQGRRLCTINELRDWTYCSRPDVEGSQGCAIGDGPEGEHFPARCEFVSGPVIVAEETNGGIHPTTLPVAASNTSNNVLTFGIVTPNDYDQVCGGFFGRCCLDL